MPSSPTLPSAADPAPENWLLAALPAEELDAVRAHLTRVSLRLGEVLYAPGRPATHVYFPETAVVSVINRLSSDALRGEARGGARDEAPDGSVVEVGTVGCEGMVGLSVFLSGDAMTDGETHAAPPAGAGDADDGPGVRAVTQVAGDAWCLPAAPFLALAGVPGPLRRGLLRYTQAFLAQVMQTAACNAAHRVEARCARWLLITRDRVPTDCLPLSRRFLAAMLGVRETGAAFTLAALAERGLVDVHPGEVVIRDRAGLEAAACPCYRAVRAEFGRLLRRPIEMTDGNGRIR